MKKYSWYVLSELSSKAIITLIMLGLAKLLTDQDYTKLGIVLSVIGLLVPLISLSMDVTLIRLEKKSRFKDLQKKQLLSTHFYLAVGLTLIFIIFFSILNANNKNFYFYEIFIVCIYAFFLALFAINERSITFNLKYRTSAKILIIPSILVLLGISIEYYFFELQWISRVLYHLIGICLTFFLFSNNIEVNPSFISKKQLEEIFIAARWITPQITLNSFYIYGDRLLAASFLASNDFKSYLIVAQVAFLLSLVNRVINTYWHSQYFNNKAMREKSALTIPLFVASFIYAFLYIVFSFVFIIVFNDDGKLQLAYLIMSIGFFLHLYYHICNASILWAENYRTQFIIDLISATASCLSAIILYPNLDWFYFPLALLITTSVQFISINYFLLISDVPKISIYTNTLVLVMAGTVYIMLAYLAYKTFFIGGIL